MTDVKKKRIPLMEGDYGPVHVWAGKYKGQNGYYYDNDYLVAVVYLDTPLESGWVLIQMRWLEPLDYFLSLEEWVKMNPGAAEKLRVHSRNVVKEFWDIPRDSEEMNREILLNCRMAFEILYLREKIARLEASGSHG